MGNASFTDQMYASYKTLLFTLAYRMLGSVMDAEDIVHEAFLSYNAADSERIHNIKSYLCKIVTNRCIDRLRSSQKKRELYVGTWLPEPLVTGQSGSEDPYDAYARQESLSMAYLLLLQQLSWVERAVFLLREVLQYEYDEIAEIVGKSPANCRQIFHRARRSIKPPSTQQEMGSSAADRLPKPQNDQLADMVNQFVSALTKGDVGQLMHALSHDAALYTDGGGKVSAAVLPILGPDRISRFFAGVLKKLQPGFSYKTAMVNGQPGIVTYEHDSPASVFTFLIEDMRISAIYIVVNPDKLRHIR